MGNRYRVSPETNIYFTTSTLVWWTPVFITSKTCDILCDSLNFCRQKKGLHIHGYVIMPTHFHAILSTEEETDLSSVLRDLKRHTSRTMVDYFEDSEASHWIYSSARFYETGEEESVGVDWIEI